MFDFLFRKRRLKQELNALRRNIDLKKAEVESVERESRKAWGKKWSHFQLQRRRQEALGEDSIAAMTDGQAEVLEIRRQQALTELKRREQELAEMRSRERMLAAELGEELHTPSEASGEQY